MAKKKAGSRKRSKAKKKKRDVLTERIISILRKKVAEGFDLTKVETLTTEERKALENISIDDILARARSRNKTEEQ